MGCTALDLRTAPVGTDEETPDREWHYEATAYGDGASDVKAERGRNGKFWMKESREMKNRKERIQSIHGGFGEGQLLRAVEAFLVLLEPRQNNTVHYRISPALDSLLGRWVASRNSVGSRYPSFDCSQPEEGTVAMRRRTPRAPLWANQGPTMQAVALMVGTTELRLTIQRSTQAFNCALTELFSWYLENWPGDPGGYGTSRGDYEEPHSEKYTQGVNWQNERALAGERNQAGYATQTDRFTRGILSTSSDEQVWSANLKKMSGASRFRSGVRMSVTERLLRQSQSSLTGGTSRNGEIIAREADFDFVGRVLASLDPSLIPLGPDERIVAQRRDAAMKSIVDLSTINMTLHMEHSSPLVQGYEARYFPMLLERWPGVIKWLEFLLVYTHATVPAAVDTIIHLCCDILDTIVGSSADNVYKEELATTESTVDLIYLLLRQKEVQSPHRYHFIVPLQARRGEGRCKIVKLFQTSLQTDAGWKAMESRLASVNRRTRDSIVRSLVTRAKEMVRRNGSFTISVLDALHSLVWAVGRITSNNCTWNAFKRAGFLPTFAAALAELGMLAMGSRVRDQQCWASIGKSVAMFSFCAHNRPSVVDLVAEGQFFGIVSLCFEHDPSPVDLLNGLDNVIPYFYLAKAYESASPMRTLAQVFKAHTGRFTTSPRAAKIHEEYTRFIEYVQMTHDGRRAITPNMCSNMKHWWSKGTFHTDQSTDGARRADWEFHLGECRALKEQYRALKSKGAWVSASTRKEQLKFLDTVTNQEVPSPTDLKKRTLMFMTCDDPVPPLHCTPPASRYGTSISTFEFFATRPDRMVSQVRLDMQSYLQSTCMQKDMAVWMPRIQRWIQDTEASPGTRALVEGAFRLHHGYSMLVLARFSYSPKAPQPTRYSVLNAIFCPILTSQLPNLTET
ncbi:hypothetical protein NMY22_g11740 [Coprinellus aureogranulatus]|nr:hypothetical protein NMY22_g11740 [Coprinellus aureogranulatus]